MSPWVVSDENRARLVGVADPAYPWSVTGGPWFDNCFAELSVDGTDLAIVWRGGEVRGADEARPSLKTVGRARVEGGHARAPRTATE